MMSKRLWRLKWRWRLRWRKLMIPWKQNHHKSRREGYKTPMSKKILHCVMLGWACCLTQWMALINQRRSFWRRIEDYYNKTITVPSNHTQCSLRHRWGTILAQDNQWSGCVDQVNLAPPSGVPITEYGPIQQEL
jgi:hypothetical protein